MNTKNNKVMPVLLAVVAVLAISTFQVFAANPSENEGFAHRSSASATATAVVDDHGVDAVSTRVGEDTTFSGTVQAITADSITIDGKVIALAAGTRLDSGVVVGSLVKIEVITQADGTLLAKEVETENETEHLTGDDHGSGTELGDDYGGKSGGSDDKSGTSTTGSGSGSSSGAIDDHGGNSGSGGGQGGSSSGGDDHGGKGKGK